MESWNSTMRQRIKETKAERKARLESSRKMISRVKESGKVYKRKKIKPQELK